MKYLNILSENWVTQKIKGHYFKKKILNVPEAPADPRDWVLVGERTGEGLESVSEFSRRNLTPSVKNQGNIGSCVGHSGRVVYGSEEEFKNKEPSPMWIYKKGQTYDPWPGEDYSGTTIRGACKALSKEGCCEEKYWPDKQSENAPILPGAKENAQTHKIKAYYVIPGSNAEEIKEALLKRPLWTSIKVREHFFRTNRTGIVDSEKYLASKAAGGHAVSMVGWKTIEGKLYWEFQNSWGKWFGDEGFFFMEDKLYQRVIINSAGPHYIVPEQSEAPEPNQDPGPKPNQKKKAGIALRILGAIALAIHTIFSK